MKIVIADYPESMMKSHQLEKRSCKRAFPAAKSWSSPTTMTIGQLF